MDCLYTVLVPPHLDSTFHLKSGTVESFASHVQKKCGTGALDT